MFCLSAFYDLCNGVQASLLSLADWHYFGKLPPEVCPAGRKRRARARRAPCARLAHSRRKFALPDESGVHAPGAPLARAYRTPAGSLPCRTKAAFTRQARTLRAPGALPPLACAGCGGLFLVGGFAACTRQARTLRAPGALPPLLAVTRRASGAGTPLARLAFSFFFLFVICQYVSCHIPVFMSGFS